MKKTLLITTALIIILVALEFLFPRPVTIYSFEFKGQVEEYQRQIQYMAESHAKYDIKHKQIKYFVQGEPMSDEYMGAPVYPTGCCIVVINGVDVESLYIKSYNSIIDKYLKKIKK